MAEHLEETQREEQTWRTELMKGRAELRVPVFLLGDVSYLNSFNVPYPTTPLKWVPLQNKRAGSLFQEEDICLKTFFFEAILNSTSILIRTQSLKETLFISPCAGFYTLYVFRLPPPLFPLFLPCSFFILPHCLSLWLFFFYPLCSCRLDIIVPFTFPVSSVRGRLSILLLHSLLTLLFKPWPARALLLVCQEGLVFLWAGVYWELTADCKSRMRRWVRVLWDGVELLMVLETQLIAQEAT